MEILDFEAMNIVKYDYPLAEISSMKTGGKARYAFFPYDKTILCHVLAFLKRSKQKYCVIGNASNVLFPDDIYDGAVVFTTAMRECYEINEADLLGHFDITQAEKDDRWFYIGAGVPLTMISGKLSRQGLSGLEFAYGIPASFGGAVYMNAGAYGGDMSQIVFCVEYVDLDGELRIIKNNPENSLFSYRHSYFMDNKNTVVVGAVIRLKKDESLDPYKTAEKNMAARREKQPLEFPSCGSAFKRPEGHYAGALIEKSGLKGANVGGAFVSEKHAGFIVNKGGATTRDVVKLMEYVAKTVYENDGIVLQPEIQIIS